MQQVAQSQAIPQSRPRPREGSRRGDTAFWYAVPTSLFVGFILLPLAALVWRAVLDPTLWSSLTKPMVLDALWVTGLTASATLLLALTGGYPAGLRPGAPAVPGQVARRDRDGPATCAPARDGGRGVAHGLWPARDAGSIAVCARH